MQDLQVIRDYTCTLIIYFFIRRQLSNEDKNEISFKTGGYGWKFNYIFSVSVFCTALYARGNPA
jgi:hypothetical protein